jgi:orotate phosphoribosyltransferase
MKEYQSQFIEFLVEAGALSFGEFTLKSGRKSPYFFNSAKFDDAAKLARLGYFYACAIAEFDPSPTVVFGPAYKGIPLAIAASFALREHFGIETAYCFDRKEAKTHGDTGLFVGKVPTAEDRVVLVDDVITDGQTKFEAIERLRAVSQAPLVGLVIALDREEKTAQGDNPVARLAERTGIEIKSVAALSHVLLSLKGTAVLNAETQEAIEIYRRQYGVAG